MRGKTSTVFASTLFPEAMWYNAFGNVVKHCFRKQCIRGLIEIQKGSDGEVKKQLKIQIHCFRKQCNQRFRKQRGLAGAWKGYFPDPAHTKNKCEMPPTAFAVCWLIWNTDHFSKNSNKYLLHKYEIIRYASDRFICKSISCHYQYSVLSFAFPCVLW